MTLKRFYTEWNDTTTLKWNKIKGSLGKIVFTNGCFDLLHAGHVSYLEEAKALGHYLVVGLNSDKSIQRLKGSTRPIMAFENRAFILSGLRAVDLVVGFEEDTPENLIKAIQPAVLVKGGDWSVDQIVGSTFVRACGGTVKSLQFKQGLSTTGIIQKIKSLP